MSPSISLTWSITVLEWILGASGRLCVNSGCLSVRAGAAEAGARRRRSTPRKLRDEYELETIHSEAFEEEWEEVDGGDINKQTRKKSDSLH